MTCIPFAIYRFSDNNLKRPYLKKGKTFWIFFIAFLKYAWNLVHSAKKEEYPNLITTEIVASERDIYLSV